MAIQSDKRAILDEKWEAVFIGNTLNEGRKSVVRLGQYIVRTDGPIYSGNDRQRDLANFIAALPDAMRTLREIEQYFFPYANPADDPDLGRRALHVKLRRAFPREGDPACLDCSGTGKVKTRVDWVDCPTCAGGASIRPRERG